MQAAFAQRGPKAVGAKSFPRRSRLLKPAEFNRVFESAVVSRDRFFRVCAREGDQPHSRLGMAVSRKVDPRATARSRIKRVIRESFRHNHPVAAERGEEAQTPGRDYVVFAAPPCASAPNAELAQSLSLHWQEIDRKLSDAARAGPGPAPTPEGKH